MKAIGNYRTVGAAAPQIERRAGSLLFYTGPRATIRLGDGQSYALPAEPFRKLGLAESDRFIMVTEFVQGRVRSVKIERHAEARPAVPSRAPGKIMVRDGLKIRTRR